MGTRCICQPSFAGIENDIAFTGGGIRLWVFNVAFFHFAFPSLLVVKLS
jgi:hypothetical protein